MGLWSGCRTTKSRRSRSESAKPSCATGLPVGLHWEMKPYRWDSVVWHRRSRLGMALFLSPYLLLLCRRPSLLLARRLSGGSASSEGCGFHWGIAVQTATRAAAQSRGVLIRKMRPFEESHTFASYNYADEAGAWGSLFKRRIG